MLKKVVFLFAISGTLQFSVHGQDVLASSLCEHVEYFASDALKGRATGSYGETLANDYLEQQWLYTKKTTVKRWKYTIQQEDTSFTSTMLGCFINNKKDSTILIGAHIDHIGYGGVLSKSLTSNAIHNGADDNASGVALLIELEKSIIHLSLNYNVLFVAYTGHEIGTFGSEYLSTHLPKKAQKLALVINFDMVGRMDNQQRLYYSCSPKLAARIGAMETSTTLKQGSEDKLKLLDTKHFYPQIPCVTFTTGMHDDYHKTSDDTKYINCEGMVRIHATLLTWILNYKGN